MTGLAVVLGVLAVVAIVAAVVTRRRLAVARAALAAADERSRQQAGDLDAAESARSDADRARSEAEARATASEEQATAAEQRATVFEDHKREADASARAADERATAAERRAAQAEKDAASAQQRATVAEEARTAAENEAREARRQALSEIAAATEVTQDGSAADVGTADDTAGTRDGLDPLLMWTLEQLRSERTWRQSVAVGNENTSVFDGVEDPLLEALQVEVDALREEVGAVIDLDAELPNRVGAAGSVLVLRIAQELLAGVVHGSEETTLCVHVDGCDVLVTVHAVDEAGQAVQPPLLLGVPSTAAEPVDGGVRLRNVIADG